MKASRQWAKSKIKWGPLKDRIQILPKNQKQNRANKLILGSRDSSLSSVVSERIDHVNMMLWDRLKNSQRIVRDGLRRWEMEMMRMKKMKRLRDIGMKIKLKVRRSKIRVSQLKIKRERAIHRLCRAAILRAEQMKNKNQDQSRRCWANPKNSRSREPTESKIYPTTNPHKSATKATKNNKQNKTTAHHCIATSLEKTLCRERFLFLHKTTVARAYRMECQVGSCILRRKERAIRLWWIGRRSLPKLRRKAKLKSRRIQNLEIRWI